MEKNNKLTIVNLAVETILAKLFLDILFNINKDL